MNKQLMAVGGIGIGIALFIGAWGFSQPPQGAAAGTPVPLATQPAPAPAVPIAYFEDGSEVPVPQVLRTIDEKRTDLSDDAFFKWLHDYLRQVIVEGDMYVRTSDAPVGSVSWSAGDARPQLMFIGCQTAVPTGYHHIRLTTSNVWCLNGECLLVGLPVLVDGR